VFREIRQPRYAGLAVGMLLLAAGCLGAGTWQIFRYQQTAHANSALRANAHAATVPLSTALVPLTGHGAAPSRNTIRFRTVTVTGSYLPVAPQFLRADPVNGVDGYDVISPMRTADGVLLVARGFAPGNSGASPTGVAPPPAGTVALVGRLDAGATGDDGAGRLAGRQLETINPARQASGLGQPVYQGWLTLDAGRPGTAGLTPLPGPDLGNPAGGAYEAQHLAYVVQWYLFALLALAAPFAMARAEGRELRAAGVRATPRTPEEARAARLADRYGRPVKS
jgi:cytochrome oxidase assembly protein ShyY1